MLEGQLAGVLLVDVDKSLAEQVPAGVEVVFSSATNNRLFSRKLAVCLYVTVVR